MKKSIADNADYVVPQISFLKNDVEIDPTYNLGRKYRCHACKGKFPKSCLILYKVKRSKYNLCYRCWIARKTYDNLVGGR